MAKDQLENNNEINDEIEDFNGENIFEDFSSDDLLGKNIEEIKKAESRDFYYYLSIINGILKVANLLLFLGLLFFFGYKYIQKNEELKSYEILSPICGLILGESYDNSGECYGLYAKNKEELKKIEDIELKQYKKVYSILSDVYTVDNFMNSETMIFLLKKSEDKFDPVNILSEFDNLKNEFEPLDKSRIECSNISITDNNELDIKCVIYSSDWDNDIRDFNSVGTKLIGGTSISVASSFIEFIEKNNSFDIIDKQKEFTSTEVTGKGRYIKSTELNLKLKYNSINNLSL